MAESAIVGILRVLLTLDSAEYEAGMKRSANDARAWQRDLTKIGKDASALGSSLTKVLTLPILGVGAGAIKAGMDFESSFAGVKKTVQATEAEFADMAKGFRNLAKEIPVNVNELNRLGEAAGALGIPKAEIVDFARVMALLGVTTNLTSDMAAEGIAKIQNIFGAAGKDTERFASTLVALGNDGASTEDQILSMATRIAGAGNALGMSQGQVLGYASALSSVGIEAEMGGSAISRVMIDIASSVSKGGSELEGFARTAGMSADQFSKKFKDDASGAVLSFIEGLGRVKTSGGDLIGTLEELGFKEIRVRDTLLRAAGAGDLLRRSLDLQAKAWKENSALGEEARKRFETTEAQLTLLWNRIKDVGITLGLALLPAIKSTISAVNVLLPIVTFLAEGFTKLPGAAQLVAVALLAITAAAGPVIWMFGQLLQSAGAVAGAFTKKGLATKALCGELATMDKGAMLLQGTLGVLAKVAAVAGAAFVGWQIGRLIADLAGLDKQVDENIAHLDSLARARAHAAQGAGSGQAAVLQQLADLEKERAQAVRDGNKALQASLAAKIQAIKTDSTILSMQDVINKAIKAGATETITYAEAVKYVTNLETIRSAAADQTIEGQRRRIESELALGRITRQQANDQLAKLKVDEQVNAVALAKLSLNNAMALSEETIRREIAATGQTIPELTAAMKKNAAGFQAWAEGQKLSAATLAFLQKQISATTRETKDHTKELLASIKAQEAMVEAIRTGLVAAHQLARDSAKKLADGQQAATDKINAAIFSNLMIGKNAQDELDELTRKRTMSRLEFELDALRRKNEDEKRLLDRSVGNWQASADALDRLTVEKMQALIMGTEDFAAAIGMLAMAFPQLAPFLHQYADGIDAGVGAVKGVAAVKQQLQEVFSNLPDLITSAFTGGGGLLGAMKAIGVQLANAIIGPMLKELPKLAAAAVAVGAGIAAGVGGAGGDSTGAMIGSITSGLAAAAIKATAWGTAMTTAGAGGAIALGAATAGIALIGVGIWKVVQHNRNLNKEVKEWNAKIDETRQKLLEVHGTLDLLDKKARAVGMPSFTGEWGHQGKGGAAAFKAFIDEFEKRWQAMHDEMAKVSEEGGRISDDLRRFISDMADAADVMAFVRQQAGAAITGFNDTAAALPAIWGEIGDKVRTTREELAKAEAERAKAAADGTLSGEKLIELDERVLALKRELADALRLQTSEAARNKQELVDLGVIAVASYGAAIAKGMSHAEALKAAQPGLRSLREAYRDLGLDVDDAFLKGLLIQEQMLTNNPALIQGVSGLAASMVALDNIGQLNAETFAAMQRTAMAMYTRLQDAAHKAGGSTADALLPMQEYLHEAARQAKLLGIPLDANTQMLIEQSKLFGIWKDEAETDAEKTTKAFEGVAKAIHELVGGIRELIDEFRDIPREVTTTVTTRHRTEGEPTNTTMPEPGSGGSALGGWQGMAAAMALSAPMLMSGHFVVPSLPAAAHGASLSTLGAGLAPLGSAASALPPIVVVVDGAGKSSAQIAAEVKDVFYQTMGHDIAGNLHGVRVALTKILTKKGKA